MKKFLFAQTIVIAVMAMGCKESTKTTAAATEKPPKKLDDKGQVLEAVTTWLDNEKAGNKSGSYWRVGIKPSHFNALRSYEVKGVNIDRFEKKSEEFNAPDGYAEVVIRAESSSDAGSPIVKDWKLVLRRRENRWVIEAKYQN